MTKGGQKSQKNDEVFYERPLSKYFGPTRRRLGYNFTQYIIFDLGRISVFYDRFFYFKIVSFSILSPNRWWAQNAVREIWNKFPTFFFRPLIL